MTERGIFFENYLCFYSSKNPAVAPSMKNKLKYVKGLITEPFSIFITGWW